MRIFFVGRKFGDVAGGVERTAITLMNELSQRGHSISLLTWDQENASAHYTMDPEIEWHKLSMGSARQRAGFWLRLQRQLRIRSIVKAASPQVIIGFQHGAFLAVRMASFSMGIPVVAAERNAPQRFDFIRAGRRRSLIFLSLLLAAKITVQFEEYRSHYPTYLRKRIVYIPNPIARATAFADPVGSSSGIKNLLFVGHLSYQKNPQVLIKAFSQVSDRFPDWQLHLIGKGDHEQEVKRLIAGTDAPGRIRVLGVYTDMESIYRDAQLFCLPSLWEGFPNALGEALAHGLPAVGFADCAGVNLLIKPGVNGLLAAGNNDAHSLAAALAELMSSDERRHKMGKQAVESVRQFQPQSIFDHWESFFQEVVGQSGEAA